MSKITQNNESATPSSPSSSNWNLFPMADGYYLQNSTGSVNLLNIYGATIAVQDEGIPLGIPGTLNFVGPHVTATISGTVARIYVSGSSSSGGVTDGDKGNIIVSGGGTIWTIATGAVTLPRLVDATAQYRLLGRMSAGAGNFQEITGSANVFTFLQSADFATMRSLLSLVTGTNVQAQDVELQSLADLISGVDRLPYFSATGVFSQTAFPAFSRTLLSGTTASAMRTTLGLYPQGVVAITDATTGTFDASLGRTFTWGASGSAKALTAPTNPSDGQPVIIIYQATRVDSTLTLLTGTSAFYIPSSISITSTPSGTKDYIGMQYDLASNKWDILAYMKGFQ